MVEWKQKTLHKNLDQEWEAKILWNKIWSLGSGPLDQMQEIDF